MNDLLHIASHFLIKGTPVSVKPLGDGLINDTYKVITAGEDTPDYVLQRINTDIFTDVDMLQRNIISVTGHIRSKLREAGETDLSRKTLTVVMADDGKAYRREDGSCWRMTVFIPRARTLTRWTQPTPTVPERLSDASRQCSPTLGRCRAISFPTSTTWNCASASSTMR